MANITSIPAARVPFIDERTGLISREWYRFFLNLYGLAGSGTNAFSIRQKRTLVTINSASSDVATFSNLPSKYTITAFRIYDASADLTTSAATIGLYTAASGGGTVISALSTLHALTAANIALKMTIPTVKGIYDDAICYTSSTLYVYNGTAHGAAATITAQLEIIDLS